MDACSCRYPSFPVLCVHSVCTTKSTLGAMRLKITKKQVDALTPGCIIADDEVRGFVARKLVSGAVTYGFRYRDRATNKQRWIGLGLHGSVTAEQARNLAKKRAGEVADGRDHR